ncbi:MAG TPA: hypothetical protein P5116_07935 [Eubacteriales bacterium]|nr:hypothetical protein [Clostridia bacterium]HRV73787.1 hypothetical protein [Eubacteriales bacterium]
MNKDLTQLVMILDRSGSMGGREDDTIGGYNSFLDKQRKQEGCCLVTTVLFDDRCELLHERKDVEKIAPLTQNDYYVRGCTALLDAVGRSIRMMVNVQRKANEDDRAANVVFVIITDGYENASREFSFEQIRTMIEREKMEYGWEFIFLGANIDAVAAASRIGINKERASCYHSDSRGTRLNYDALSDAVHCMRESGHISEDWSATIAADFSSRKRDDD